MNGMSGNSRSQMSVEKERHGMRQIRRLSCVAAVAMVGCVMALLMASMAQASTPLSVTEYGSALSIAGQASRQAGAHADFRTKISFATNPSEFPERVDANVKDVLVDLPPGLIANPTVSSICPYEVFVLAEGGQGCPLGAQVGLAKVLLAGSSTSIPTGIYSLQRPIDAPAFFGFNVGNVPVFIKPTVRAGDYGITSLTLRNSQAASIKAVDLTFWGVPGDPSHNSERLGVGSPPARLPFFSNPTFCPGTPAQFSLDANSWEMPEAHWSKTIDSDLEGTPFTFTGCEKLAFSPRIQINPESHVTASPTGVDVNVDLPQNPSPDGLSTADVRKTVVTLPKGVAISASAAGGIGACTEAEINLGSNTAPTCPGSSSLGTVRLQTPLLEEELEGELFLAKQYENPFHSFLAIYVAIKAPGFYIKFGGKTEADPVTGQVKSVFEELPQLPFGNLKLSFRGGAKAPLVSPTSCGTYNTHIEMTSWASSEAVQIDSPILIDEGCGTGGFEPKLHAGSTNPIAGLNTPFNVQITRRDGEQNISQIETTLPEGLVAKLAGMQLCSGAQAASGNCPASSQIGNLTVAGGTGPLPLYIPEPGRPESHVYFGGPYKDAPYSMVFAVPAQAGAFDLGTVVVRAPIYIDPTTTQVTVKSDPLPQILEGVPIEYRDMRIEIRKPDFTLNPTNCGVKSFQSRITSNKGQVATPSARFQVADCAALGFKPSLAFKLKGGTHRGDYPALNATLTARPGDANIAKAAVTLPHSEFLAQEHIRTICTRVQFASHSCPEASIYGTARATSPLIEGALEGPVYLRSSSHPLPDLVADLNGAFNVVLVGRIDSFKKGIRNTFEMVPDAPVTKFTLSMQGGKKGLLVNSSNLCKGVNRANVNLLGQNGKTLLANPVVANSCRGKANKGKRASATGKR